MVCQGRELWLALLEELHLVHYRGTKLVPLREALLKDDRRTFPFCCLIKPEHVCFSHEIGQLVVESLLTSRIFEPCCMLLDRSWNTERI